VKDILGLSGLALVLIVILWVAIPFILLSTNRKLDTIIEILAYQQYSQHYASGEYSCTVSDISTGKSC
jgi:hypothetical protein